MDLRLYLRGLGIGILVTAIVLGFTDKSVAVTDDEIREKARSLGMIDNVTIAQLSGTADNEDNEDNETKPEEEAMPPDLTSEADEFVPDTESLDESIDGTDETLNISPEDENEIFEITIRINSGDDSFRVSSRLEEAGLVSSAAEYNSFLMDNGYSRRLRAGSYTINTDADYETIARILTGQ